MAEIHIEEHSSPIKTPKQLLVVVILAFAVPVLIAIGLSQLVTGGITASPRAMTPELVEKRIAPVGRLVVAGTAAAETESSAQTAMAAAAPAAKQERSGEQIYNAGCGACHAAGVAGAPKFGDAAAWAPRIALGLDALTASVWNGKAAMPPKGGIADASKEEIARAVAYMANKAGANFKAPEAAAPGAAPAKASAGAADAAPAAAAAPAAQKIDSGPPAGAEKAAAGADGEAVYNKACLACHSTGAAGAPKIGDKAAWAPRIAQGNDTLYTHAIKGKGVMPAKGGMTTLTDAEVKAAVDYLVSKSK
jgi:cytochrome c5